MFYIGQLGAADLPASECFQGEAQEPVAELVAGCLVVRLRQLQQRGQLPTSAGLFLLFERLQLRLGEEAQVPEAVERGEAAHPEVLCELDDIVELDVLAPRGRPDARLDPPVERADDQHVPARVAGAPDADAAAITSGNVRA